MAKKSSKSRSADKNRGRPRRGGGERGGSGSGSGGGGGGGGERARPNRNAQNNAARQVMAGEAGAEILYGKHSIKAVLLKRPKDVERLAIAGREEYHQDLIELAHKADIEVIHMEWPDFISAGRFTEAVKELRKAGLIHEDCKCPVHHNRLVDLGFDYAGQ